MNIQEAKEEIIRTVRAYLAKDETGNYLIPREKQRPLLLIGAPGIGKTAVMRQAAEELGISLVSYTITHHTRQSAVGLPVVSEKEYGGRRYSVTEYTMSEIIASVYDQIERSGIAEGILFLDEINCVSETLAPTMLQFLQYKTFGAHQVPEGYVIVTAGNPPEYNKSVRDFDIVTLDRVRRLDVKEDFPVWKRYALRNGVHGAVLSYLEIKKDRFYSVQASIRGKRFVTARGWEDLSDTLRAYEKLGFPVGQELVQSFLQEPETAEDFSLYYVLYRKYREKYRIPELLAGSIPAEARALKQAPFDEKLSLISLLVAALGQEFREWEEELMVQRQLFSLLKELHAELRAGRELSAAEWIEERLSEWRVVFRKKQEAKLFSREEEKRERLAAARLAELLFLLKAATGTDATKAGITEETESEATETDVTKSETAGITEATKTETSKTEEAAVTGEAVTTGETSVTEQAEKTHGAEAVWQYARLKEHFSALEERRNVRVREIGTHLDNAFHFLAEVFGEQQEMVLFLSELDAGYHSLHFVRETGNESYYRYNKILLLKDRREELKEEVMRLL